MIVKISELSTPKFPLLVIPDLANAIGLNEAIVYQQLLFMLEKTQLVKEIKGKKWTFSTYEQWQDTHFPFWSIETIKRIFIKLERIGVIESCQPEGSISRKKYYRIKTGADIELPEDGAKRGFVYVMRNKRNDLMKIGFSTSPKFREKTLQSEEPEIEMVATWEGTMEDEKNIHERYSEKRIRGEWFNLSETDLRELIYENR